MGLVLMILALFGFGFLIQLSAKMLLHIFFHKEKPKNENPYIKLHKAKEENDKNYDEYLNWLDKKGSGIPIKKMTTQEDSKVESKIRKLF